MDVISSVSHTLKEFSLLQESDSVLLAVSGGPDSVAMAHIFSQIKGAYPKAKMAIAHFDHAQRPNSKDDMEFVRLLAQDLNMPFFSGRMDESFDSNMRMGLEAILREKRYAFLIDTAVQNDFDKIALAHNMDDQAETFLFRMLRGSGGQGLSGMKPKTVRRGIEIIRPFLFISKSDILKFLSENQLRYCIDPSNKDITFTRNKIRLELLPVLENGYNSKIKKRLSDLARVLADDYSFLEGRARALFKDVCLQLTPYRVAFSFERYMGFHISMRRMLFRLAYESLANTVMGLEFRHWEEFSYFLDGSPYGAILDLPKGVSVCKKKKMIEFYIRRGYV